MQLSAFLTKPRDHSIYSVLVPETLIDTAVLFFSSSPQSPRHAALQNCGSGVVIGLVALPVAFYMVPFLINLARLDSRHGCQTKATTTTSITRTTLLRLPSVRISIPTPI